MSPYVMGQVTDDGQLELKATVEFDKPPAVEFTMDHDPGFAYRQFQAANIERPCVDIDQIVLDEHYEPVAVIETTHCATYVRNKKFLEACDARMKKAPQGKIAMWVANLLGVPAYWVAFTLDFESFAIRRLDSPGCWHFATRQQYIDWIHGLGR